ncbi:MAG: hypothetical protein R2809_01465 [Flavobacteriales bacterium]
MSACLILLSCKEKATPIAKSQSIYFWETSFELDSIEEHFLDHNIEKLYCRFFDIDWDKNKQIAIPIAPISWVSRPDYYSITPVVFIKNTVFENISADSITALAEHSTRLIDNLAFKGKIEIKNCQIDCDWTVGTKDKYFQFLKAINSIRPEWELESTIRLHQIKYAENTGVPPVARGVLMYYNMGKISSDESNSILDNEIGKQYLDKLKSYPLPLNAALPVFSWAIHIRDKSVVQLISEWDFNKLANDSIFHQINENRFVCIRSGYYSGAYLRDGDEIKLEGVNGKSLSEASKLLSDNYPELFREVIFFDLDSKHISELNDTFYDSFILQE